MKLLKRTQSIPGGLMLVPMAMGALVHTFCPEAAQLGNPFSAVFSSSGTMCVVGMMLIFAGIQTNMRQLVQSLRRCGSLILLKLILNIAIVTVALTTWGKGGILGISLLAFAAALTSCNPGVYIALMEAYGDEVDKAGFALLNLVGLPFVPVCILGAAGGAGIDWRAMVSTVLPFLIGMVLAAIDPEIRVFAASGTQVLLPFLGYCLGSSIDLKAALPAVGTGALLYCIVTMCNLAPLLLVDRVVLKQKGHCAAAICCVAGLAITVPSLMAQSDVSFAPYTEQACAQVAVCVISSSVVTPLLVQRLVTSHK